MDVKQHSTKSGGSECTFRAERQFAIHQNIHSRVCSVRRRIKSKRERAEYKVSPPHFNGCASTVFFWPNYNNIPPPPPLPPQKSNPILQTLQKCAKIRCLHPPPPTHTHLHTHTLHPPALHRNLPPQTFLWKQMGPKDHPDQRRTISSQQAGWRSWRHGPLAICSSVQGGRKEGEGGGREMEEGEEEPGRGRGREGRGGRGGGGRVRQSAIARMLRCAR